MNAKRVWVDINWTCARCDRPCALKTLCDLNGHYVLGNGTAFCPTCHEFIDLPSATRVVTTSVKPLSFNANKTVQYGGVDVDGLAIHARCLLCQRSVGTEEEWSNHMRTCPAFDHHHRVCAKGRACKEDLLRSWLICTRGNRAGTPLLQSNA